MINDIIKYTGIFILLVLLQILVMDNIGFSGYVNPYIYILFILLLPLEIPAWLLLLLSFASGIVIDLFAGTLGLHAAASVVAGFSRPYILRLIAPRDGYEQGELPGLVRNGFRWFFIYISLMVLIHHTALFYFEVFRFSHFFLTFVRVILSSLFSIVLILIVQTIFIRR